MQGEEYTAALVRARGRLDDVSRQHLIRWVIDPAHLYLEDRKDAPLAIAVECSCGQTLFLWGLGAHIRDVLDKELNLPRRSK